MPPIHLVQLESTRQREVLDGQQRLAAIRDFAEDRLSIDGTFEPLHPRLQGLHNYYYSQLPAEIRRIFDNFAIRIFVITNYQPEEPGELFYRLNQPTNLTAAEQRNAFYGPARGQVRDLVSELRHAGIDDYGIGFSNSRMAYDDVLARVCVTFENGTLRKKITAAAVTQRYRASAPFSQQTIDRIKHSIWTLSEALRHSNSRVKFNKATFYSWLLFLAPQRINASLSSTLVSDFIDTFETYRTFHKPAPPLWRNMIAVYNNRASSRVADISSVLLRDLALWGLLADFISNSPGPGRFTHELLVEIEYRLARITDMEVISSSSGWVVEQVLEEVLEELRWGMTL